MSVSHKVLMNGIRKSLMNKNPYECMKVAQRLSHSCKQQGINETIRLADEYLESHSSDACLSY